MTKLSKSHTEKCRTTKSNGKTCNHGKGAHPSGGACRMKHCTCGGFKAGS